MPNGEHQLDDLVDAVLDGEAVDWVAAESSADAVARPLVRHLRLVSSIARVHRDVLPTETLSPPVPLPEPVPRDRWGHLRILERVGRGAFGEVFRAWDTRLDREVALKVLPAGPSSSRTTASAIIQEGRLLAKVRHPNVVTIHGAEQIGDEIGLWMEFVRGQTLEQLLLQGTALTGADAIAIGVELCRAVSAVHAAGLLHRDIKAHNVTRAEDGRVVLMDFGTGRELVDCSSSDLAGTPLYLAPEVLAGGVATVRSDIYSLGVLLYHLVTGSYPVRGRTIRDVRRAHERNERVALRSSRPDVRPALARVIDRAIDPQPERRYATADALARDLVALQRRPALVRLRYGLAAAAAILLGALVTSEVRARLTGDRRTMASRLVSAITGTRSPATHPVIVVLPFRNLGTESPSSDVADGLTVGLMHQLSAIEGLGVTAPFSSFAVRDAPDLRQVGEELGASHAVRGTAELSGDRLRVTAELVLVAGGVPLWSHDFERVLSSSHELLSVQDEIARGIVNQMRVRIGHGQRRCEPSLPLPLYYQYIKAQLLQAKRGTGKAAEAASVFEGIVANSPGCAPAWAGLASALAEKNRVANPEVGLPSEQDVERVRVAAKKAIDLDPMLAEAHAAIAVVYAYDRQWPQAEAAFERSLQLNPSRTITHTDFVLSTLVPQGRSEEALQLLAEARTADPLSLDVRRVTALIQVHLGQNDEAIENCRWVLARDDQFPYVENFLGRALIQSGRLNEAISIFQKQPRNWGMRGYIYAVTGRRAEAEALAADHPDLPGHQVLIYAGLGDKDRAFAALERLAELNWWNAAYFMQRPEVALLRGDPRVAELRRRLRLPEEPQKGAAASFVRAVRRTIGLR